MNRLLSVHRLHYRMAGAEAVHLDHLALFRERGWTCAEFAMQHPKNEASDFAGYFPSFFNPADARGLERVTAAARFIWSREARTKFAALLDDFRPDVIHVHGTWYQLTPSIFGVAKARGIPIVHTLHDYQLLCPAHHMLRPNGKICESCKGGRQYMAAVNRCLHDSRSVSAIYALEGLIQWYSRSVRGNVSLFVGPARALVDKFIEHGFPREQMRYVPNFFETTDDTPVSSERVAAVRAQNGPFVLCFGRLASEKGLPVLVEAAHRAGVRLVLAGTGPEEPRLRAQAAALGADVQFTGHLAGEDLWAHVEACHAVALPSIWYEIAPKALLEAQSRGKIIIASDIGGMPEMVKDRETGFLVPPRNVDALARVIRQVVDLSDAERQTMGEAGRDFVLTTFTRDRYYREMTRLYEEVLGARETVARAAFA